MTNSEYENTGDPVVLPDMKGLLQPEVDEEIVQSNEVLFNDPDYYTVSLRRHGRYERGDNVSHQRGQLTQETIPEVREKAAEWVAELPDDAELHIINSPTFMPGEGRQGERIEPKRAKATGAIYGLELRKRFGEGYGYLADESLSEEHRAIRDEHPTVEHQASRYLDTRVGDIFENTTKEESEFVPGFFKALSAEYGGLTPDFWRDFIHGDLPPDLNAAYLKAGGDLAVEKASMALDVLGDLVEGPHDEKKQIGLIISHEEVIGSLAYQIQQYLKDNDLADEETLESIEQKKFSYNEGFDIHIDGNHQAVISMGEKKVPVSFDDLRKYVSEKAWT